ncbi:MAG: hypothetical protein AAF502_02875 [Bacteroidota bacterium]
MKHFDHNGHLNTEGLALYVDALKLDKTDKLPDHIVEHIDNCKQCHVQAIEMYASVSAIDYSNLGDHPVLDHGQNKPKPTSRNWLWLFAILLAVTVLWVVNQNKGEESPSANNNEHDGNTEAVQPKEEMPRDSIITSPPIDIDLKDEEPLQEETAPDNQPENNRTTKAPELIAMDFTPFDELENQVGEVFRSDDIEIISPPLETRFAFGKIVNLVWEGGSDDTITIKIFDNKNNLVLLRNSAVSPYRIGELKHGLYYWKLETEDDLIHVGKFFVDPIK